MSIRNTRNSAIKESRQILEVAFEATGSETTDYTFSELKDLINEILDADTDFHLELSAGDVRVIDKDIIDDLWTESIIEMVQECYNLEDVPRFIYIDWEQTAENLKIDGLGHHFSSYDGEEWDASTHYVFRTN